LTLTAPENNKTFSSSNFVLVHICNKIWTKSVFP